MDEIKVIEQEFDTELQNVKDTKQLDEIRVSYLGKKGKVTNAMSKIRDIVAEKRKEFGQSINQIKNKIEDALASLSTKSM